jgi:hypothetical protein
MVSAYPMRFFGTQHWQNSSRGMSTGVVNLESTLTRHASRMLCRAYARKRTIVRLHQLTPHALNKCQSFWMTHGFLVLDGILCLFAARHRRCWTTSTMRMQPLTIDDAPLLMACLISCFSIGTESSSGVLAH